jgi:hypothetical protein
MIVLAIIGALVIWFVLGYLFELTLRKFFPDPFKRRPGLLWIEAAVVYGPIGLGVLVWEHYESRRWSKS